MVRACILSLIFLSCSAITALPAAAQSAHLQPPPPPPRIEHAADLSLGDAWIARMADARERRQGLESWGLPLMLGGVTAIATAAAVTLDVEPETRAVFAASAALGVGGTLATMFSKPTRKGPWFVVGWSTMLAAFGVASILQANQLDSCDGWCYNEKALPWLASSLLTESVLFLPMAFVDRGPTLAELEAYRQLPPEQRVAAARRLLARIDHAERKASAINTLAALASVAVLGTGAALVRDRRQRAPLLGLGGLAFSTTTIMAMVELLKPTRLERLLSGKGPRSREAVLW